MSTRDQAVSYTTAQFTTSLIVNIAVAGGELAAFVAVRGYIRAVYEPRTYIPPKHRQAKVLGRNLLQAWRPLWEIFRASPEEILEKNGVDPYVFVRFLNMMSKALIPIWFLSWIVLLPVNSVGTSVDGKVGLDRFTAGNIALSNSNRFWAHLILDYIFIFWIIYLLWIELQNWLVIRQRFLIDPSHSKLPQANTVLVEGIPLDLLDEEKLAKLFAYLPGGVRRIWLARNLKEMPELFDRRVKAVNKLEQAQVKLIKFAQKYKMEREAKIKKLEKKGKKIPEVLEKPINSDMLTPFQPTNTSAKPLNGQQDPVSAAENGNHTGSDGNESILTDGGSIVLSPEDLGRADQLVPRDKRPIHRIKPRWAPIPLGWLGIGQKVDTIDWARDEIHYCSQNLRESRERLAADIESPGTTQDYYNPMRSAFIHFNQQIAAHMAAQILIHHKPYNMSEAWVEQSPSNVIWANLNMSSYDKNIRYAISVAATAGLIIAWAFPVAFIGALSNVAQLVEQYPWMAWLGGDSQGKQVLQGVICGLLPPILLALLNLLLPAILRFFAVFQGMISKTNVELDLMTRYFIFLTIHTFIIVTLASGLTKSLPGLASDPASIAVILSTQMPGASTFFITLILTQFTGTIGNLLQPITLTFYYLKVILGGGTPRSVYTSRYTMQTTSWGAQFPQVTVYMVIMLAYMVISPIIVGFGACFALLSGLVFKYLFIWVYDQPKDKDTGGLFFPKAITQVFVGMYIQEIALCAFFFLLRDPDLNPSAIPQGALMVVLIVITAACHATIYLAYRPLIYSLPLDLAHLSYGMSSASDPLSTEPDDIDCSNSPTPNSESRRKGNEGLRLAGFNVPLPEPLQGVQKHANKHLKMVDGKLGGERLTLDMKAKTRSNTVEMDNLMSPKTPSKGDKDEGRIKPSLSGALEAEERPIPSDVEEKYNYVTPSNDTAPGPPTAGPSSSVTASSSSPDTANAPYSQRLNDTESSSAPPSPKAKSRFRKRQRKNTPEDILEKVLGDPNQGGSEDNPFFALPGGPGIQKEHEGEANDPQAFFHPATKEPQRIIWLPKDELGLCAAEIQKNKEYGIRSSSKHAVLNSAGKVRISGGPPDDI